MYYILHIKYIIIQDHGEYFYGYLPPVSLVVGLIFRIHSWFVIKTTEHHLRYYAFKNDTDVDEKMEVRTTDSLIVGHHNHRHHILYFLFANCEL